MRAPLPLAWVLFAGLLELSACGKLHETTMVDPRTGAMAYCRSGRFNLLTTPAAVAPLNACVDELSYYGFRDEAQLRAATVPPPQPTLPMAAPQPLPWLPAQGQLGPVPQTYAPPVYSGPVTPAY